MTFAKKKQILDAWAYGPLSAKEIAKELGITKNIVVGQGWRIQQHMGAVSREHLKKFCTGQQINWAAPPRIPENCTVPQRIMVTPKARRPNAAQLARRAELARLKREKERLERERIEAAHAERERLRAIEDARRLAAKLARIEGKGVSIFELRDDVCHAVIGTHPLHAGGLYCGQPVDHQSYCEHHCRKYLLPNAKKPKGSGGGLVLRNLHAYAT